MVANQRDFKPMKWFEIGPCFHEALKRPGAGVYQFNADIGEDSAGADAELIALAIDTMQNSASLLKTCHRALIAKVG